MAYKYLVFSFIQNVHSRTKAYAIYGNIKIFVYNDVFLIKMLQENLCHILNKSEQFDDIRYYSLHIA